MNVRKIGQLLMDSSRGRHLSYARGKRNTSPGTSLIKIEGVDNTSAAKYVAHLDMDGLRTDGCVASTSERRLHSYTVHRRRSEDPRSELFGARSPDHTVCEHGMKNEKARICC